MDFGRIDIPEFFQRKRLEDELRREKEFNATLIQTSPAFFTAIAADSRTLLVNDALLSALGYARDEVIGKNYLKTFVPKNEWSRLIERFRKERPRGALIANQGGMIARDGQVRLVEWRGRQVLKANGKLDYFFALGVDITERQRAENEPRRHRDHLEDLVRERTEKLTRINRRLEEEIAHRREAREALQQSETMLEAIFDQTFQFIVILDLDGAVVKANKTALELAGAPEDRILSRPFWETGRQP